MLPPPKTTIHQWLVVVTICCLFCVISIAYLDRPIVDVVQTHSMGFPPSVYALALHWISHALTAMFVIVPLSFVGIIRFGLAGSRRAVLPQLELAWAFTGFSVCGSLLVNELLLKPLFGRYTPGDYFTQPSHYGFVPSVAT